VPASDSSMATRNRLNMPPPLSGLASLRQEGYKKMNSK
jgi:hypothetical protein